MKKIIILSVALFLSLASFAQAKTKKRNARADTIAALIDGNDTVTSKIAFGIGKKNKTKQIPSKKKKEINRENDTISVSILNISSKNYLVEVNINPEHSAFTPKSNIKIGIGGGLDGGMVSISRKSLDSLGGKIKIPCVRNEDFGFSVSFKIFYDLGDKDNREYTLYRLNLSIPDKEKTAGE